MKSNWLYRSMEQDAQRIEVWMPKTDNEKELAEFRLKVDDFITKTGLSRAKICKMIDVDDTRFSQFMNNKYPGKIDIIVEKITNFINNYQRRSLRIKEPEYVNTNMAKKIISAIRRTESYCQSNDGRIMILIGDAGSGKTKAIQEYSRRNANSAYVEMKNTMGAQGLFSAIAKAIEIDSCGGVNRLAQRISENLQHRDMTIMIDEASKLDTHKLDMLRQTICLSGCTLVLAGNQHLLKTIQQDSERNGYEALDQFRSRIICVMNLNNMMPTGQNGGGITTEDINGMFDYGIKLTPSAIKDLKTIIKSPKTGRMRLCCTIINNIHNSIEAKTGQITEISSELISVVIKDLGLDQADEDRIFGLLVRGKQDSDSQEIQSKTA